MTGKIELLVSTMKADDSLLDRLRPRTDVVVVNQCDRDGVREFVHNGNRVTWIDSTTRGLSKSRNIAIRYAAADIALLTDDDMEYVDEYPVVVEKAFERYPNADIISFQVSGIESKFKDYGTRPKQLGYLGSMRLSSVELALRLERIRERSLYFREEFGSGAKYKMGEENIFLFDCLKNRLKIVYTPELIAGLHMGDSTWFHGFDSGYFFDRGATYYEMFGRSAYLAVAQFLIRKRRLYAGSVSTRQAWTCCMRGVQERKKEKN